MTQINHATRGQLSGFYGDDRLHYQALVLEEVFHNSRVCQRMVLALGHLRGRVAAAPAKAS